MKKQVTVKKDAFTVMGIFPRAVNFRAEIFRIRLKADRLRYKTRVSVRASNHETLKNRKGNRSVSSSLDGLAIEA